MDALRPEGDVAFADVSGRLTHHGGLRRNRRSNPARACHPRGCSSSFRQEKPPRPVQTAGLRGNAAAADPGHGHNAPDTSNRTQARRADTLAGAARHPRHVVRRPRRRYADAGLAPGPAPGRRPVRRGRHRQVAPGRRAHPRPRWPRVLGQRRGDRRAHAGRSGRGLRDRCRGQGRRGRRGRGAAVLGCGGVGRARRLRQRARPHADERAAGRGRADARPHHHAGRPDEAGRRARRPSRRRGARLPGRGRAAGGSGAALRRRRVARRDRRRGRPPAPRTDRARRDAARGGALARRTARRTAVRAESRCFSTPSPPRSKAPTCPTQPVSSPRSPRGSSVSPTTRVRRSAGYATSPTRRCPTDSRGR